MNKPKYLIVHHEAPPVVVEGKRFNLVNDYHKWRFNFISELGYYVGYQYFLEKDGEVRQARKDTEEGAHTIGLNTSSIGICLAGNFDLEMPTQAQKDSLRELLLKKMEEYKITPIKIVPHRRYANKSCYGNKLSDTWARNLVEDQYKLTLLMKMQELLLKVIQLLGAK